MSDHAPGCGCGPIDTTAPIAVSINPEARVTVARTGTALGDLIPGQWHTIGVAVRNDGFVAGPLAIEAPPVNGVDLDLPVHELTGHHRQDTAFGVRLHTATTVEVNLTFRALAALGGLANHSTLHLLLRCT
ncbi:hypothetical protein [Jiangella asiatica]|uniref:DUF11 domain-containing protein n=1 Tax=Jiangella asiatica TaxID=2530372 RepID=A0A4R5DA64_9ACTN|nr:hypothetical protein [Jiangella asiatica]TDE09707.1 hypothetical protein E1269_13875 [Jiangella asiatica]